MLQRIDCYFWDAALVGLNCQLFARAEGGVILQHWIGLGAHQASPQDAVERGGRNLIGLGEVEASRGPSSVLSAVLRLERAGQWSIDWEAQGGASAAACTGPLLFSVLVGPSFLQRTYQGLDGIGGQHELRGGLLAMAGAGGTF